MRNIMLDLETLGHKPGCIIVAIGAVEFETGPMATPCLGREFYMRIDACDAQSKGLTLDASTFLWWLGNTEQARREITQPGAETLARALMQFSSFYGSTFNAEGKAATLWGNGADFDQPILAAAYEAVCLKQPWSHYQSRCYRTIKNLHRDVAIEIEDNARHNALADAKAQALHLMKMLPGI